MSEELRADCVVVGGGPAGSTTALLLARAGFDVLLLEHREFPRAKPCGDCISPQANRLLAELGLLERVLAEQPARLAGWRIHSARGSTFSTRFADCTQDPRLQYGLAISRDRFDRVLLHAAKDAGVRVHTGVRVEQVLREAGCVAGIAGRRQGALVTARAPLTIGADGLRSVIRQRLGMVARSPRVRKVGLTAHVDCIGQSREYGEMHLQDGACVGIAPVSATDSRCNLTLVVNSDRYGRALAGKNRDAFREQLDRFPALRELTLESVEPLLASGPYDRPTTGTVTSGAALVGDAAGYFDPFTGQGIYQALAGAHLLAAHAVRALHSRACAQPMRGYAREQRTLIANTSRLQRGIDSICARPRLAELCIGALANAPRAARQLIAVTGDFAAPVSLLSPGIAASFLLGLTLRGNLH